MRKTWLITGSSRGFGWELAQAVLDRRRLRQLGAHRGLPGR